MGKDREYCGAKKTHGGTCKQPAGLGTGHVGVGRCKFHGGATPAHEKAGAEEMVKRGLLFYGAPIDIDAHEALIWEVERTAGHVAYLDAQIAGFDWKEAKRAGMERDEFEIKVQQANTLYRAERKHMVNVCQAALAAGVDERRVRVAERTGAAIVKLLDGIFADLKLTKTQQRKAPGVVRKHLTVFEGGREAA